MIDQQIESASTKLVQFIQNLENILFQKNLSGNCFQIRSDYARELASLFEVLVLNLAEEQCSNTMKCFNFRFDPSAIFHSIQSSLDRMSCVANFSLIGIVRNINEFLYNFLCHLKNKDFLNYDLMRLYGENLCKELRDLADCLINSRFNTFPFQNSSNIEPSTYNNCPNETLNTASNNCYHCSNCQPDSTRCFVEANCAKKDSSCFSVPPVYTPEMDTLFSSGGIVYVRKSGDMWVAENLGNLFETLHHIGQNIDVDDHSEIYVRKSGRLTVRRKRGRRKRPPRNQFNQNSDDNHLVGHEQ